ncbi:DUF397 domain-containing protein [Stackebrandtia soli]|uniref:DUF397 domain-containing protein n=1 Tax=Stackebrandtia soli TaxID=1892856 RepID=UPI0039EBA47A
MTPGKWRKSSRSAPQGANCVETRKATMFEVRDSKLGDTSPILAVSREDFVGLLDSVTH